MNTLTDLLLLAPDGQLDASMKTLIEKWDEEPTSIQILEVLDNCIYSALASDFVVSVLQALLDKQLNQENKKLDDIVPLATWRNQ
jgi:DNA-binding transcriptional ArsR family regulator